MKTFLITVIELSAAAVMVLILGPLGVLISGGAFFAWIWMMTSDRKWRSLAALGMILIVLGFAESLRDNVLMRYIDASHTAAQAHQWGNTRRNTFVYSISLMFPGLFLLACADYFCKSLMPQQNKDAKEDGVADNSVWPPPPRTL